GGVGRRTGGLGSAGDGAADVARPPGGCEPREARMTALRRFKYRHLLRIGARDLLGDADLAGTTEELSHLADACIAQALGEAAANAREAYGAPLGAGGAGTGGAGGPGGQPRPARPHPPPPPASRSPPPPH